MITEIKQDLREVIKGKIAYAEPMSRHTSFHVGGPADIWVEPMDVADLKNCLQISQEKNIPVFILGGGRNLLVGDSGIRGIVINMQTLPLKYIYHGDREISVTSSATLGKFLKFCIDKGLCGLEFLAGIPGSLGGAVMTNAGARHYKRQSIRKSIGDFIEEVKVIDYNGNINTLNKRKLTISYKSLGLESFIILEAKFLLTKTTRKSILNEYQNFLKRKFATQELNVPSAGCMFKNPAGFKESAGELIEKCGLKGKRIGSAAVSKKHANFIVNKGDALAKDVTSLVEIIKGEVKNRFNAELSLEIKIV